MLTLILGPSGSGKSVRLREELRQRARSRQRSILIVPEQFTSSTEGALYHALGDELSAYVESYSFTSLAETLLDRKSTRLNSSHRLESRMPSSA